eukprot:325988-Karenia_brevis.AAC.1
MAIKGFNSHVMDDQKFSHESTTPLQQQCLSKSLEDADHAQFMAGLSMSDQAYINSEMLQGASDWLDACPDGDKCMGPEEFAKELRMRLLQDIFPSDAFCDLCGE